MASADRPPEHWRQQGEAFCPVNWGTHGCMRGTGHGGVHECSCCTCPDHAADYKTYGCVALPPYYEGFGRTTEFIDSNTDQPPPTTHGELIMEPGYQQTYTASTPMLTVAQLRKMLKHMPDGALIRLTEHPDRAEHAADGITLTLVEHLAHDPKKQRARFDTLSFGGETPRDIVTLSPRKDQP